MPPSTWSSRCTSTGWSPGSPTTPRGRPAPSGWRWRCPRFATRSASARPRRGTPTGSPTCATGSASTSARSSRPRARSRCGPRTASWRRSPTGSTTGMSRSTPGRCGRPSCTRSSPAFTRTATRARCGRRSRSSRRSAARGPGRPPPTPFAARGSQRSCSPGHRAVGAGGGRTAARRPGPEPACRPAGRPRPQPRAHRASVNHELGVDRTVVISWLCRGTLHLVRRDDLAWLHGLTAPTQLVANRRRLEQEGVSDAMADRAYG